MHVRLADESVCIGPPPARGQLSQRAGTAHRLRDHRRRRRASRLRIPFGECALCRDPRRARHPFHRSQAGAHPADGRQDRGQAHRAAARHPGGAGLRRRRHLRPGGAGDGTDHRLPGADQGGGRRRRPRHEGRRNTGKALRGARHRARGSEGRLRRRRRLSRKIPNAPAAHRDSGAGRRRGPRHPSRRTRLLAAASASESMGGKPLARPQRRRPRGHRRDRGEGDARVEISRRRHGRIPL